MVGDYCVEHFLSRPNSLLHRGGISTGLARTGLTARPTVAGRPAQRKQMNDAPKGTILDFQRDFIAAVEARLSVERRIVLREELRSNRRWAKLP